jgi:UrcA family protein
MWRRVVMNKLTIVNPRFTLLVALAASTAGTATAANSQGSEHVIVDGTRQTTRAPGRSEYGTPIEERQLRGSVNYSDLDPSIPSNAKVLRTRVHDAAREICERLDQMYPSTTVDECTHKAERDAKPQVTAAIANAETRRHTL